MKTKLICMMLLITMTAQSAEFLFDSIPDTRAVLDQIETITEDTLGNLFLRSLAETFTLQELLELAQEGILPEEATRALVTNPLISFLGTLSAFSTCLAFDQHSSSSSPYYSPFVIVGGYANKPNPQATSASNNAVTLQSSYPCPTFIRQNYTSIGISFDPTLNPNGKFGISGYPGAIITDLNAPAFSWRTAIQYAPKPTDQKIIFVGFVSTVTNVQITNAPSQVYQLLVLRYNWDGSFDTTFNPTGAQPGVLLVSLPNHFSGTQNVQLPSQGYALTLGSVEVGQVDQDIFVTGTSNGQLLVAKILGDGTLDTTFNPHGFIYNLNTTAQYTGNQKLSLQSGTLLNKTGVVFGSNGQPLQGVPGIFTASILGNVTNSNAVLSIMGIDNGYAIKLDAAGNVVVAGWGQSMVAKGQLGLTQIILMRITPTGQPDPTFGKFQNGTVTTQVLGVDNNAYGLVIQPSGKIVVDGMTSGPNSTYYALFARYLPNGTLDPDFGNQPPIFSAQPVSGFTTPKGVVYFPINVSSSKTPAKKKVFSPYAQLNALTIDPSGNLVGIGYVMLPGGTNLTIQQDGPNGLQPAPYSVTSSPVCAMLMVRLTPDGVLDTTFNPSGPQPGTLVITVRGNATFDDKANDVACQPASSTGGDGLWTVGWSKNNSYSYSTNPTAQTYGFAVVIVDSLTGTVFKIVTSQFLTGSGISQTFQ